MLLCIDIGNTTITVGVFEGSGLTTTLRVATDTRRQADEYGLLLTSLLRLKGIEPSQLEAACISSVVPPLTAVLEEVCQSSFGLTPLTVSVGTRTGMQILYDSPRDVGTDRIVGAVAAKELYGTPLIVVDIGTATVFDAVNRAGEYLGGAIAPGINLAAEALFLNTSQLRRVELVAPKTAIGQNTTAALQSGLVLGYVGLVTTMIARFKDELGQDAKVIGTGGLVGVIARETDVFDAVNQDLTLVGLRLTYDMNQQRKSPALPSLHRDARAD